MGVVQPFNVLAFKEGVFSLVLAWLSTAIGAPWKENVLVAWLLFGTAWAFWRVVVWVAQTIRPRYFICPTSPRRVKRAKESTLEDALDKVTPDMLPPPGRLVVRDFRDAKTRRLADASRWKRSRPLRVATYNIERGIQMDKLLEQLMRLDADVVLLQEVRLRTQHPTALTRVSRQVDIRCERSNNLDTGAVIAKALKMQLIYVTEFIEYASPLREALAAGGGVHGNAIVTRLNIHDAWAFQHEWEPYHWPVRGPQLGEPRKGARVVVGADLVVPRGAVGVVDGRRHDLLRVYSCHLENFCGAFGRYLMFTEVLRHLARREMSSGVCPVVVGGDMNTLCVGITRWFPLLFDHLNLLNLGTSEARFWKETLLTDTPPRFWGVLGTFLRRNFVPARGLKDHFHPERDFTIEETSVGWSAKVDWLLTAGLRQGARQLGGGSASDHQYLSFDCVA